MQLVMALKPMKVLDVGTGFGKYGVLCREYLDLWDGRQKYEFTRQIDGVEAFRGYITPLHEYVYNNLYEDNIMILMEKMEMGYDLVLLIDVLEHFEKDEGRLLLNMLLAKNTGVLVCTPKRPSPQKDAFGNIFETHRTSWTRSELLQVSNTFFVPDRVSFICYMTNHVNSVKNLKQGIRRLRQERSSFTLNKLKINLAKIPLALKSYKMLVKRKTV
jgi:hypothetical protein